MNILVLILTGSRGQGHIVATILSVLDRTNVGSISSATVGASEQLPSDMYLISLIWWTIVNYVRLSCNKLKCNLFILATYFRYFFLQNHIFDTLGGFPRHSP